MSSTILERRIKTRKLLLEILEGMDAELEDGELCMRPGGPIDLSSLGDNVWREQFRYALC